jgi:hypothetical protein
MCPTRTTKVLNLLDYLENMALQGGLVVLAVCCERVSASQIPENRETTANFQDSGVEARIRPSDVCAKSIT